MNIPYELEATKARSERDYAILQRHLIDLAESVKHTNNYMDKQVRTNRS